MCVNQETEEGKRTRVMSSPIRSIALIHTPCYELEDDRLEPPLGLLYLATYLNVHGYPTRIIDLASTSPDIWQDLIPEAQLYGFSTYTATYQRTLEVMDIVRRVNPHALTVAGGPHATALPETVARDFDWVIAGEGEAALLQLVQALSETASLPRILQAPPVANLDTLPFPDYRLVEISSYHREVDGRPSLSILSSRGCPYQCVFCNSVIMGPHKPIRFRSADNVAREMQTIAAQWGVTSFRFQDDLFTVNLPRLRELTARLRNMNISYRCFGRVNLCTPEVAALLVNGGCRHIAFGVESGSNLILDAMHKGQTAADIRFGIANAKAAGLIVRVYLMVGFPGETWETVQETVDLMLECQPHEFSVYPLIPYPGTPLYQQPEEFGILQINTDFSQYFQVRRGRGTGFTFRTATLDENLTAAMRKYVIKNLETAMTWAGDSKGFK